MKRELFVSLSAERSGQQSAAMMVDSRCRFTVLPVHNTVMKEQLQL